MAGNGGFYTTDTVRQKFTGQERDTQTDGTLTGLDYFQARYYSPVQGRFTSADPGNAGADPSDPQTWNGYAYVDNNPMANVDPDGLGFWSDLAGFIGSILGGGGGVGNIGGTLGGCGGPLGNCGSLGGGPWSEQSGLGGVQDPGRFIFSATGSGNGSGSGDWLKGVRDAALMTFEWHYGVGPRHRTFGPNTVEVKNMRYAPGVDKARQFFYNKVLSGPLQPVYNYQAGFGLKGYVAAGLNPTQQFVGNYRVDIAPTTAGDGATFTLTNTTSFTSFFYGIAPSWERHGGLPMGNASQSYYWTEAIPETISNRACGR